MNKEKYNQIIDDAYKSYVKNHKHAIKTEGDRSEIVIQMLEKQLIYSKEEFINKCKTDSEFSEKWGLKIEEKELSENERYKIFDERGYEFRMNNWSKEEQYDKANIPTKLTTITYNNETIEVYE